MSSLLHTQATSPSELRSALKVFEQAWNIVIKDDWYKVSSQCFRRLQRLYDTRPYGGVPGFLQHVYPDHSWEPAKFRYASTRWDKPSQEKYMVELGQKLGFTKLEDWYSVSSKDFTDNGGSSLVTLHNSSPPSVLMAVYPNHTWVPWKFHTIPTWAWEKENAFRQFAEHLGESKGFKSPEDWYRLSWADIKRSGGNYVIAKKFESKIYKFIEEVFPEYELYPWLFDASAKDNTIWDDANNQRDYIHWLGEKLRIKSNEDWYKVTEHDFLMNKGEGLLQRNDRSVGKTIASILVEHPWEQWKFTTERRFNKDDKTSVVSYMEHLGNKLGYTEMEDWYRVTMQDFHRNDGSTLIHSYKNVYELVKDAFPNFTWLPWRFYNLKGLWDSIENRATFLSHVAKNQHFSNMEDWYKVSLANIRAHQGGASLLKFYNNSPPAIVMATFPEHKWELGAFQITQTPDTQKKKYDDPSTVAPESNPEQLKDMLEKFGTELGLRTMEDWYLVTPPQITRHLRLTRKYVEGTGLDNMLRMCFPQHNWDSTKFMYKNKTS